MADFARATLRYTVGSSNDLATVSGTGATQATAVAELGAKVALMRGVGVSGSISVPMAPADFPAFSGNSNDARAAILTLKKAGYPSHTVRIPNMRYDIGMTNDQTGQIDTTHASIVAFGAAFVDADGVNGYSVIRGQYLLT